MTEVRTETAKKPIRVLLLDDRHDNLILRSAILRSHGYEAVTSASVEEAETHLQDIDIAFLPMNLPYTMTPEMVAEAAKIFKPKMLYPYHFGDTDPSKLVDLLKSTQGIEVRIRKME